MIHRILSWAVRPQRPPERRALAFISAALAFTVFAAPSVRAAERPNVIVILADDMGYSDIGCYGGEAQTPVLDGLAQGGIRFTQFYNTARCCPTRASLLTGLYPHQAGIGWMMADNGHDGYRGELNRECRTLAEVLRPAGYGTYMAGKWHVTSDVRPDGDKSNWPLQRGFDQFYGTIHGAGSFFDPNSLTRNNTQISPYADSEYQPETYYYTDAISDHAVRYINAHTEEKKGEPFFLYVAYTAAHWPMHALPEDIARYEGRFDAGYDRLRQERLQRMKLLNVIDDDAVLSPAAEDWESVQHRAWELRCMEVYAAMIDRMDQGIGRIVASLRASDQLDNTLILYMQDNGGCAETLGRKPKDGQTERADGPTVPPMAAEALQFDMVPKQARDGFPVLMGPGVMPGPADTYIAYGRGWANVSNTPFREYKHWVHEGGISTPLIAHWPNGIIRPGETEATPGHLVDVMATLVDVAGAAYPTKVDDLPIQPMEGRSLAPTFSGESIEREALYWEHEGNRAVRKGDWKLVAKGRNGAWELYDLSEDREELHDLAEAHPDRTEQLAALWQAYAERARVLPLTPYSQNSDRPSRKKRFRIPPDARWSRKQSPDIAGKGCRIQLEIKVAGTEGVLIAQGGSASGYALFLQDGELCFDVQQGGNRVLISGGVPPTAGPLSLEWTSTGGLTVRQYGKILLHSDSVPLLKTTPLDGLDAGIDTAGLVGPYSEENAFNGDLGETVLVLTSAEDEAE